MKNIIFKLTELLVLKQLRHQVVHRVELKELLVNFIVKIVSVYFRLKAKFAFTIKVILVVLTMLLDELLLQGSKIHARYVSLAIHELYGIFLFFFFTFIIPFYLKFSSELCLFFFFIVRFWTFFFFKVIHIFVWNQGHLSILRFWFIVLYSNVWYSLLSNRLLLLFQIIIYKVFDF